MSHEIMLSELDLFKKVQFQGSLENSQFIQYRPISTINDTSSIEFDIPIASDEYLDPQNVFIMIKGKVVKSADDTDYAGADNNGYSIINYAVNTIFDQLAIYMNGTLVSQSSKTYHYMSYIQALTESSVNEATSFLKGGGFYSYFGVTDADHDAVSAELHTIVTRSKIFTLFGKCHGDIFKLDRLIINGITLHLSFSRAPNPFIFRGSAAVAAVPPAAAVPAREPKLDLRECILYVRKVKPTPNILTAHAKVLHSNKAIYPFKRTNIKVINLPANQSSFTCDNIYMNQMPCKLILGMVSNDAFSGTYLTNPLAFKPFNLSFLAVYINGEMFPKTPYEPDFTDTVKSYQREYCEFLLNLASNNPLFVPPIDIVNWAKGLCLFCFNFNSDFQNTLGNDFISLAKEGFLSIELRFRENLGNALKLICYAEFDNVLEIDEARNVTVDFS